MARPIDEYIVRMQLDNDSFKSNAKETVGIFGKIKEAFSGKNNKPVEMTSLLQGFENMTSKFKASSVVAINLLNRVTDAAIQTGKKIGNALYEPLVEGGKKRALNIEQAMFQFKGLGMDVEATMENVSAAVVGTQFGLDEAALAASMFGASGMRAGQEMEDALRGISGVAAMAGASYTDIANVFTTVAGNGRVMGNDLLRLSSRGVNAAATLAKYFTKVGDGAEVTESQVREMVTRGEVDFATFAAAMNDAFGEHATKASETYAGALSLVNSSLARIGETMFAAGFQDKRLIFNQLKFRIDEVHEALKPLINTFNEWKSEMSGNFASWLEELDFEKYVKSTQKFVDLGGIKAITDSFESMGSMIGTVLRAIGDAWRNVVPAPSVDSTLKFVNSIQNAFAGLESFVTRNGKNIENIFTGIFAIMDVGWYIVTEIAKAFIGIFPADLVSTTFDLTNGFANFALSLNKSVKEGKILPAIIEGIANALSFIISSVEKVSGGMGKMFEGTIPVLKAVWEFLKEIGRFAGTLISDVFGDMKLQDFFNLILAGGLLKGIQTITDFMENLSGSFKGFMDSLSGIGGGLKGFFDSITSSLKGMADNIKVKNLIGVATAVGILAVSLKLLEGMSLADIAKGVGAIAASLAILVTAFDVLTKINIGKLDSLVNTGLIIGLATAVTIMAGAMKKLSDIDGDDMGKSVAGLMGATLTLVTGMKVLAKAKSDVAIGTTTMIGLAAAIKIITSAVLDVAGTRTNDVIKGIGTVGMVMMELALLTKLIDGMRIRPSTATSFVIIGAALNVIAGVVGDLGSMAVKPLIKGIGSIGLLLTELALFSKVTSGAEMMGVATSMVILGVAIEQIVGSVGKMSGLSASGIIKGLGALGVILAELAIFSRAMSGVSTVTTAASMTVLATSIRIIVPALEDLSKINFTSLLKSVGALGVILAELVIAMNMSSGSIAGASGLTIMAAGIAMLVPPLEKLGKMSLWELGKALTGLAGGLAIIGGLASVLGVASPLMLGFAAALLAIGAAVAVAGVGLEALGQAFETISRLTTTVLEGTSTNIGLMLDIIIDNVPKMVKVVLGSIAEVLKGLRDYIPEVAEAGLGIILGLLRALNDNIFEFIDIGIDIAVNLAKGLTENVTDIINAGMDFIIAFIDGATEGLREHGPRFRESVLAFIGEIIIMIIETVIDIVDAFLGWIPAVSGALDKVGTEAAYSLREAFGAGEVAEEKGHEFTDRVRGHAKEGRKSGQHLGEETKKGTEGVDFNPSGQKSGDDYTKGFTLKKDAANKAGRDVSEAGRRGATDVSHRSAGEKSGNDYTQGFTLKKDSANRAGKSVAESGKSGASSVNFWAAGSNAVAGFIQGLGSTGGVGGGIWGAGVKLASTALSAVKSTLGVQSPATELIAVGEDSVKGFVMGLEDRIGSVESTGRDLATRAKDAILQQTRRMKDLLDGEMDYSPVVTPVLDMDSIDFNPEDYEMRFQSTLGEQSQRYRGIEDRYNQNGYNSNTNGEPAQSVEYHAHLTALGSLPKSTIDRMARDFDDSLKNMEDRRRSGRGEDVDF